MNDQIKIVFTGAPSSGKTTAIHQISEIPPLTSEAITTDEYATEKPTTTVGMDYGEVDIGDDLVLHLYGTPGQRRFRHMWELIASGALGVIVLVDNSRPLPLSDIAIYLDAFSRLVSPHSLVVGITKTDVSPTPELAEYERVIAEYGMRCPILAVDVREHDEVLSLIDTLLTSLEGVVECQHPA